MDFGLLVRDGGMALTLSPKRAGLGAGGAEGSNGSAARAFKTASSSSAVASPTTVLWRAFDGVAAAGASPRTLSEDGGDGGSAGASPDASGARAPEEDAETHGLTEHMAHVSQLVRGCSAALGARGAPLCVRACAARRGTRA
jgi:hypothetical protein